MENNSNDPCNQNKDSSNESLSNDQHTENIKMVAHESIGETVVATTASSTAALTSPAIDSNSAKTKKKITLLAEPNVETICDDIASTTEDIKRLKHVQVRSNSTGKLYNSSRRVSFPENDSELVTGYLEPADPWACVKPATCVSELAEFYRESCKRHNAVPIDTIMKHLETLDLNSNSRRPVLNLREQNLTAESCEALEEVLKRVQYKLIDLTDCGLTDASATALFDMIEYYESANEIDISENRNITNRGWQACINMVKRSHALQNLVTRGTPLSDVNAVSLGKSMLSSSLTVLKLEHCGLSKRPISSLCTYLRKNTVLKELWLAHNDLTEEDAYTIGNVLKSNFYLQFLDLSNNNIQDRGTQNICEALIEQANYFKVLHGSNATQTLPILSKHTLTRGDKIELSCKNEKESKYECLARLINSTKTPTVAALSSSVPASSISNAETVQTNRNVDEEVNCSTKSTDAIVNAADHTAVTLFRKSDNNNRIDKPTDAISGTSESAGEIIELKIVEQNEQNAPAKTADKQTSSDNEDDFSIETSNSTTSLDSSEKSGDMDAKTVLDNNNTARIDCTEIAPSCVRSKQKADAMKVKISPASKDDLTKTTSSTEQPSDATQTSCHLDINENKSDMKLNYAEVVKVENAMESQLCENKNFDVSDAAGDNFDNKLFDSTRNALSDLRGKVQISGNDVAEKSSADSTKRPIEVSSPKPIQANHSKRNEEQDDEMSPICKVRLPLNSPRLTKSKDIMSELPLTPDSSHSLDSSCEFTTPFEIKPFSAPIIIPERSFSSESLNSETSVESNDSKSSIKLTEAKFSKNGTLERQSNSTVTVQQTVTTPNGLQVLMLWNNHITRGASQTISDLLAATTTLEVLNVGKNVLSNDFIANIKASLKANTSLTSLGLQSVHLSNEGVKTLSEILDFGGNVTLQRVDLRDNNLQVSGLTSLNEVLKSNKSITRIDLDDVPRRAEHSDSSIDYNRVVNNIRSLCARNENPPEPEPVRTSVKRVRANFLNSRKISLTCQSIRNTAVLDSPQKSQKSERHLLDPTRKSSRLRSPSPSPIPSPVSSPIPSPSRSRFQVSRVVESNVSPITPPSSNSCSPTSFTSSKNRFRVTVVEPPQLMSAPVTIINSTIKELNEKSTQKSEQIEQTEQTPTKVKHLPRTQSAPTSSMSASVQAKDDSVQTDQPPASQKPPSIKATDQHIATTLTVIDNTGNSFDSPDLEVKGYMDDSCSSFSSLDSIDRGQDFNASFSSMESYDILRENKFTADGTKSSAPKHSTITKTLSNSSIENVEKAESSASSLEASTCSNDSIYGSQEFPVLKISSNEGTLTNSPVSPCSGDVTTSEKDTLKVDDKQRVRKTSWISRQGDAVPATLDKLLSIFHHPGNLFFTRSSNGELIKKEPAQQTQSQEKQPPNQRKESPMGGLFAWTKKENVFDEALDSKTTPTEPTVKIVKSPLQSNVSPENTLNAESIAVEAIPVQLKQDAKENISPEHTTVTADGMANLQSKGIPAATSATMVTVDKASSDITISSSKQEKEKVHFEVGSDGEEDYDEDEDGRVDGDIRATSVNDAAVARHSPNTAILHAGKALGLGQITRDSLSILKGSSNNSQDSMRSLESLSEITFEGDQLS